MMALLPRWITPMMTQASCAAGASP